MRRRSFWKDKSQCRVTQRNRNHVVTVSSSASARSLNAALRSEIGIFPELLDVLESCFCLNAALRSEIGILKSWIFVAPSCCLNAALRSEIGIRINAPLNGVLCSSQCRVTQRNRNQIQPRVYFFV